MQPAGPPTDDPADHDRLHIGVQTPTSGSVLLRLVGPLDLLTAENLEHAITSCTVDGTRGAVIDLSTVTFIGSAGLAAVIKAQEWARAHDVELRLVASTHVVLRPLEVTGLTSSLPVLRSVEDALSGLPGADPARD